MVTAGMEAWPEAAMEVLAGTAVWVWAGIWVERMVTFSVPLISPMSIGLRPRPCPWPTGLRPR
ncbi:hypothetical protein D3C76_1489490 [compost metagenome]